MKLIRAFGLVALAASLVTAAVAQDSFSLKRKPKVNEVTKLKLSVDLDIQGMSANFSAMINEKITKVNADGSYVVETTQANAKINFGGQEQAMPDTGEVSKSTYHASGWVTLIEGSDAGAGAYRLSYLQTFVAPDAPKKVGDKWESKLPANAKTGAVAGVANYEVMGTETIGAWKTVKVKWSYKESEGGQPASGEGFVWLNIDDFSMVKAEGKLKAAPLPGMEGQTADMTIKMERTS